MTTTALLSGRGSAGLVSGSTLAGLRLKEVDMGAGLGEVPGYLSFVHPLLLPRGGPIQHGTWTPL